ncbi:MAG: 3-deoxy-8-phosphooctulonate synthase [Candidatus Eiseniibacteriota bacterium]|nr:MAG: 3-deoxy-8-phosphooctulonate synthase [Candidatus Eisenbacteria bacterium]
MPLEGAGLEGKFEQSVRVGDVVLGGEKLALIAGPCVIESREQCLDIAEKIKLIAEELSIPLVFKASYLKANRSSVRSFEGPGLEEGLRILREVKEKLSLPVLSDVHCRSEAERAAEVLDIIQVPAFLCRQTKLLQACAATGKPVNVKKGQFMAPEDTVHILEKLASFGCREALLTERGTCFGYHNLVVDMRGILSMRSLGVPVVFDVTHSLQKPGGEQTSGDRSSAATLARAAVAAGSDALFIETHQTPESALSDSTTMLPLSLLKKFMQDVIPIREAFLECSLK